MVAEQPEQHDQDAPLRADIRRVGILLGKTLVRQEGQALLALVEEIRAQVRADPAAAAARLSEVDVVTGTKLARAFSTYFHLANIIEQVHRARELRRKRAERGGWLDGATRLIAERGVPADELAAAAAQAALYGATGPGPTNRRLAELIDLLWQTDELRLDRPDPTDEARNAVYYLTDLYADAAPQVLTDLADALRVLGVDTPPAARPLTFGTWIGGRA